MAEKLTAEELAETALLHREGDMLPEDVAHALIGRLLAHIDAMADEIAAWKRQASEVSEHVESQLVIRLGISEDTPGHVSGWKGLGLKLKEALDERDRLRAEVAALKNQLQAATDAAGHWMRDTGHAVRDVLSETVAGAGAPDGHETQATVTAWQDTVFGPPHGPAAPLMRAINEMVEACISLGIERGQFLDRVNTEYDRQIAKGATVDPGNLPSEVAGVVTILYRVAQAAGFDLQQAMNAEMRKNRGRTAFSGGDGKMRPGREHDRAEADSLERESGNAPATAQQ